MAEPWKTGREVARMAIACFFTTGPLGARKMGNASAFDEMIDLAARLGVVVRHVRLGGGGGGMVTVKGQRQLFIDQDACPMDQLERTAQALGGIAEVEQVFVRPDVRELIAMYRRG